LLQVRWSFGGAYDQRTIQFKAGVVSSMIAIAWTGGAGVEKVHVPSPESAAPLRVINVGKMVMGTRGRRSIAELMVVDSPHGANRVVRPDPPRSIGAAEATVWREIVATMPAGHFAHYPSQILLGCLCRHTVEARFLDRLLADSRKQNKVDREHAMLLRAQSETSKVMLQLQRAMRLTHQQTIRPDSAKLRPSPSPVYRPWDMKKQ
jgi:hypothetical protein